VGLYWVPGHVGVRCNETVDRLTGNGSTSGFVGLGPALGVSRQDLRNKIFAGWGTSTGDDGRILATPNDRITN
jgi:hypothetical protein